MSFTCYLILYVTSFSYFYLTYVLFLDKILNRILEENVKTVYILFYIMIKQ